MTIDLTPEEASFLAARCRGQAALQADLLRRYDQAEGKIAEESAGALEDAKRDAGADMLFAVRLLAKLSHVCR